MQTISKLACKKMMATWKIPALGVTKSYLTSENQSTLYINLVYPPFFYGDRTLDVFFPHAGNSRVGGMPGYQSPVSENKLPRFAPFVSFMFSLFKAGDFCSRSCSVA